MRQAKAKRLRRERKQKEVAHFIATGEKPTKTKGPTKPTGRYVDENGVQHNRAMRRMKKYQPKRYQDLELENDPAAKRILARRWNWIFSDGPRKLKEAKANAKARHDLAAANEENAA